MLSALQPVVARFHSVGGLASLATLLGSFVLVERRGRRGPTDPMRQMEIRTVLESMPDSVVLLDLEAKITDVNAAAERISGLSREQLIGMEIGEFARHMDGDEFGNVVKFEKPIAARALAGEPVAEERRTVRHPITGAPVELLVSASPVRNEQGETQGALMVARDVTELTNLQQRMADVERHNAIGHVAAGIAHDFNNTLQTISQAVALLQMSPERPVEERAQFLDMIQNAVRRGAEVIGRIRDYLRSGNSFIGEVDAKTVLEEAIELTNPLWQPSHTVEMKREMDFAGKVRGNAADLRRVFTNLIINGLQAMPEGGTLIVGCEDKGRAVHVWICDTGHGISPELKNRIFNPYFTTKAGGTGLGLSGAQKILLEIGGNITFTSEVGKGTQFDLSLPKPEAGEQRKTA